MNQNTISKRCNWNLAILCQIFPNSCNTQKSNVLVPSDCDAVLKSVFLLNTQYRAQLFLVAHQRPWGALVSVSTLGISVFSSLWSELHLLVVSVKRLCVWAAAGGPEFCIPSMQNHVCLDQALLLVPFPPLVISLICVIVPKRHKRLLASCIHVFFL